MLKIDKKTIFEYEVKAIHKEFNVLDKDEQQEFKVIMDIASNITIWKKEANRYTLLDEKGKKEFFLREGAEEIIKSRGTPTFSSCEAAKQYIAIHCPTS